jgi:hypothetical protein
MLHFRIMAGTGFGFALALGIGSQQGAAATVLQVASPSPSPEPSISAEPVKTLVPRGTVIVLKTLHGINSYGQEAGNKLTFEVVQDVVVDGHVVTQAGDVAEGAVENAQAGKDDAFSYAAANLRIRIDSVFNFCGDTLNMDFVRSEYRRRQGLLGSHKDVEVVKGQMYQAATERPEKVCGTPTTEAPLPIPSGALPGDKD